MQYMDVDLKDIPTFSCVEGQMYQDFPDYPGVCRVSGASFMVGGRLQLTELNKFDPRAFPKKTKWLWSAPAPPIAGGDSFTFDQTRQWIYRKRMCLQCRQESSHTIISKQKRRVTRTNILMI